MKMKRNKSIEKVATSLRVFAMVSSKSSNLFQVLANLNTLRSRKARKAVTTDPVFVLFCDSFISTSEITISTKLPITMSVSKILNHQPLKNILKPTANNLITSSRVNKAVKNKFNYSIVFTNFQSTGYQSKERTKVLKMIKTTIISLQNELSYIWNAILYSFLSSLRLCICCLNSSIFYLSIYCSFMKPRETLIPVISRIFPFCCYCCCSSFRLSLASFKIVLK